MRLIALLLTLALASPMAAAVTKEEIALWDKYNANRVTTKAAMASLESGNTVSAKAAIDGYSASTAIAKDLNRVDIEAWHHNNGAYAGILLFKETLDWVTVNDNIKNMGTDNREQRKARLAAVKSMQTLASTNWQTLVVARASLNKAKATGFERADFDEKTKSNLDFITWVEDFLKKDL